MPHCVHRQNRLESCRGSAAAPAHHTSGLDNAASAPRGTVCRPRSLTRWRRVRKRPSGPRRLGQDAPQPPRPMSTRPFCRGGTREHDERSRDRSGRREAPLQVYTRLSPLDGRHTHARRGIFREPSTTAAGRIVALPSSSVDKQKWSNHKRFIISAWESTSRARHDAAALAGPVLPSAGRHRP